MFFVQGVGVFYIHRYDVFMEKMKFLAQSQLVNISIGALLGAVWMLFAAKHVGAFIDTGKMGFLLFCFSETLQAFFFIIRKIPKSVSVDPFDWLVGVAGSLIPLFFRPGGESLWQYGEMLVLFGVVIQVIGLMSLNRSFAIVAANREIKTRGLYRFVRHPMYASYLFLFSGYILFNASWFNLFIVIFSFTFLFLRVFQEEKHLSHDPIYRDYKERVRYRLIPFIF